MLPTGRLSVNLDISLWPGERAGQSIITKIAITNWTAEGGCPHLLFSRDMDLHLIDRVVEVTTRIPDGCFRLNTTLRVGGARQDRIISSLRCEFVMPQPPRVAGFFLAQRRGLPRSATIG